MEAEQAVTETDRGHHPEVGPIHEVLDQAVVPEADRAGGDGDAPF